MELLFRGQGGEVELVGEEGVLWERGRSGVERGGDTGEETGGIKEEQISHDIICEIKSPLRL